MEDWTTEFVRAIEQAVESVEAWTNDAGEELDKQFEEWSNWSDEVAEQMYAAISEVVPLDEVAQDVDRAIEDWLDWLEPLFPLDDDGAIDDWGFPDSDGDRDPFVPITYVRPTANRHPACRGCQHYHGQMYGDNLLVCGMHPYGWDGEDCPDWDGDERSPR